MNTNNNNNTVSSPVTATWKVQVLANLVINLISLEKQASNLEFAAKFSDFPEARARFAAQAAAQESDNINELLAADPTLLDQAVEKYEANVAKIEAQYDIELGAHLECVNKLRINTPACIKEEARWEERFSQLCAMHDEWSQKLEALKAYKATIVK